MNPAHHEDFVPTDMVMLIDDRLRWRPWEIPPELLKPDVMKLHDGHFWFLVRLGGSR